MLKWLGGLFLLTCTGCMTIGDRLENARDLAGIAQATASYYVDDAKDESGSVAIVTPTETFFASAGSATERSLFRVASLSKLYLHLAIDRMLRDGRLDLGRRVCDCSKLSLPPEYRQVKLNDLLMNHSGLPREFLLHWEPLDTLRTIRCGFFGGHVYAAFDDRRSFERMMWRPWWRYAVRHPREIYSNVGFGLLGMTLEDMFGASLETVLREEVTGPMRLADTTYEPTGAMSNCVTRACAGHLPWLIRRKHDVPDIRLGEALRATGGLFSSVHDCARGFAEYWHIIDQQLQDRPLAQCADGEDYGLLRVKVLPSGRKVLYRSGMIYGGASFVGFDPDSRVIVVILRNVTSWPDHRGFEVMEKCAAMPVSAR